MITLDLWDRVTFNSWLCGYPTYSNVFFLFEFKSKISEINIISYKIAQKITP